MERYSGRLPKHSLQMPGEGYFSSRCQHEGRDANPANWRGFARIHLLPDFSYHCFRFYRLFRAMKLLHLLLATFTFFTALNPCNDAKICADKKNNGTEWIAQAEHEHSAHERDVCTPFCTCTCCSAQLSLSPENNLRHGNGMLSGEFVVTYSEAFIIADHRAIWQPPKI